MSRTLFAVVAGSALAFAAVVAAPPPTPPATPPTPPPLYFPTTVGDTWVETLAGRDRTYAVTAVESKGEAKVVTVSEMAGDGSKSVSLVMEVSGRGLYCCLQAGTIKHDPPFCLLKSPHQPGDQWEFHIPKQPQLLGEYRETRTVKGTEVVKVRAGQYDAIRVDCKGAPGG